jgi:tetratricopeptide (TPR) repeat protein
MSNVKGCKSQKIVWSLIVELWNSDLLEGNLRDLGHFGLLLSSIILITAAQAFAADDVVTRSMKLYEKRHYVEAASALHGDGASIERGKKGAANLALGMIYFKNAVLHCELYDAAVAVSQDYLKKLSAAQGKDRSHFVDLYFGQALVESGKIRAAAIYLQKFSANGGAGPRYRAIAKVSLGLGYYQNNESKKATELWGGIDVSDPEVKAELAAAFSKAGLVDKNPFLTAEGILSEMKRSGKPLSMRIVKNLVAIYARGPGLTEKGLDLLKRSDLKAFSYRETLGKSKVIHFYDLSLLNDMAILYSQASLAYLEKATADPKVKEAAKFYLGQAYGLFGSVEESFKIAASFIATSGMSDSYKDRIRVWQGANLYMKNRPIDAVAVWDELMQKKPEDPDLIAEILFACNRLRIEYPKALHKATAMVEAGEGKKFSQLNVAIGKYYLGRFDHAKAISYLEAGRDKSNKNKIESNDPILLVSLAEAYYQTKKFSEALEIYFEMSKQFPEVRQIQEAMQGVYAMEHQSAGDVKIN